MENRGLMENRYMNKHKIMEIMVYVVMQDVKI